MKETIQNNHESFDDRAKADLLKFIAEQNITIEEVRGSYFRLCGIEDGEGSVFNEALLHKMDALSSEERVPLNCFVDVITELQDAEQVIERFDIVIENLDVTENEKHILNSIVHAGRKGELEFLIDDREVALIDIGTALSPKDTADRLVHIISNLSEKVAGQDKSLSIQFTEE